MLPFRLSWHATEGLLAKEERTEITKSETIESSRDNSIPVEDSRKQKHSGKSCAFQFGMTGGDQRQMW